MRRVGGRKKKAWNDAIIASENKVSKWTLQYTISYTISYIIYK